MKLNLKDMTYYFLTCCREDRKNHMINQFKDFKLIEVNPIMKIGKRKSGATGFIKILDLACINQDRNKPFQPFAIFEDDVKKNRDFPSDIEIPDDVDILYIGISMCGVNNTNRACRTVCLKNIDKNIVRIYNMLSTHGMIICSIRGVLSLQKCMLEGYFKNKDFDLFPSQMQPHINVYALKNPLVYQYSGVGGLEEETKITFIDKKDKAIPDAWINKDNISIITNYK